MLARKRNQIIAMLITAVMVLTLVPPMQLNAMQLFVLDINESKITLEVENGDSGTLNSTPVEGSTVNLLGSDALAFAQNYARGAINKYYTRYDNKYVPAAFEVTCDKKEYATLYTLKLDTKPDLSTAKTYTSDTNSFKVLDLFNGTDYYYEVTTNELNLKYSTGIIKVSTAQLPRTLYIDSIGNTRDLGGCYTVDGKYRMKQGIIYRGANVDKISAVGKQKMLDELKIKTDLSWQEIIYFKR